MAARDDLREFLKSRRDRLSPSDLGLTDHRPRRVPGLRREEVARLAGVSVDYYTRLEQGRDISVSRDVLDAIANALQLTEAERHELFTLAHPTRALRRTVAPRQRLRGSINALVDIVPAPALVLGRRLDVLASNTLARALLCDFSSLPPRRRNHARWIFLDPLARERYREWETVASGNVTVLRAHMSRYPDDTNLTKLVADLANGSAEFAEWWADPDLVRPHIGVVRYNHPAIGELTLEHEAFVIADADGQVLHVDIAEPGSKSELALQRLSHLH